MWKMFFVQEEIKYGEVESKKLEKWEINHISHYKRKKITSSVIL